MAGTKETSFIRSRQKYGIISQNIMRNNKISPQAKAIYAYLASFEDLCHVKNDSICYEMGIHKETVKKYMWELQCWGILEIEQTRENGRWSNNLYIINSCPDCMMMDNDVLEQVWPEINTRIKGGV